MEIEFSADVPRAKVLPSLDRVRAALATPSKARSPMWTLMLAATLAAVAGVSAAAVMILGPSGGPATSRTAAISAN